MSEAHFKLEERRVARLTNGKRSGYQGQEDGDVNHPKLYIQVKDRKALSLETLFEEVEGRARKQKKIPLLSVFDHGRHRRLWVMRPQHVVEVARVIEEAVNDDTEEANV